MNETLVHTLPELFISLTPVLLFLAILRLLDSYKLVSFRSLLGSLLAGIGTGVVCLFLNDALISWIGLDHSLYSRALAPVVEESAKASFVIVLIVSRRVGFMVDGAIHGFAVGAGFAVLENTIYLISRPDAGIVLWIVRGLGTAMMHGAATSIVGMVSTTLVGTRGNKSIGVYLPGLAAAAVIHAAFNQFFIPAALSAAIILFVLPLTMVMVFTRSEHATRQWLGIGFDTDRELLEMLSTGNLQETKIGKYLDQLENRFHGIILADMLNFLRVHLELSISAKGLLLMRQAGFDVKADPEIREKFAELQYLERSIGPTGKLAILPFIHTSARDLWQLHLLSDQS
jgi:RsiW-degrading membrane proteinase PrsW (M82 family)